MTDGSPVFNQLNIVAEDFDATVEFYRRLGVNILVTPGPDDRYRHASSATPGKFIALQRVSYTRP